mmetsp:Transcript_17787/g.21594  ORF Transcript_17787/g.21594 Transcript_17787/m.21594 type:complete len:501 (+) Transcript_17787:444-1946(+)
MGNESSRSKRFSRPFKKQEGKKSSNSKGSADGSNGGKSVKQRLSGSFKSKNKNRALSGGKGRKTSGDKSIASNGSGNKTGTSEADSQKGKTQKNDANKSTVESSSSRPGSLQSQVAENSMKNKVSLADFVLIKTVGKGSFGKVIQVKKKDCDRVYAMKVLKKEQVVKRKQFEHTMAERRILEEIDHPFIVSLRFAFQTTQKLYMIFDFFNGGELFHYLSKYGKFGEERSRLYAAEIALGLEHIHSMNIIYRDLKPENLLLDADGHIRITDFGLSKENVVDDTVKSFCGTPEYLAPEVLKRMKYGKAVDWWSLGTLLYEMISGLPPFYDRNRERMYKKILTAELRFPAIMNPEARSICRGMLQRDPLQRLGYYGAQEIKNHPFFASLNWDDVYNKRVTPPFKPVVASDDDTRNVDKTFTSIPAAVTPTPNDGGELSAALDKDFTDFTYTATNVIDGQRYSVSWDHDELVGFADTKDSSDQVDVNCVNGQSNGHLKIPETVL